MVINRHHFSFHKIQDKKVFQINVKIKIQDKEVREQCVNVKAKIQDKEAQLRWC
jgi:hypothetical protein